MERGQGVADGREVTAHRGWRGKVAVGALAAVVSLVVSSAVFVGLGSAGEPAGFDDVPPSHPFYEDIGAVAANCISGGYDDGGFHPADPVTRQAMAAFLNRSMGRVVESATLGNDLLTFGDASPGVVSTSVPIATVTVAIPDLPGNCLLAVHLEAHASLFTSGAWASNCHDNPCNGYLVLRRNGLDLAETFTRFSSDWDGSGVALGDVAYQADGTTQTYELHVRGFNVRAGTGTIDADRRLVATVSPR